MELARVDETTILSGLRKFLNFPSPKNTRNDVPYFPFVVASTHLVEHFLVHVKITLLFTINSLQRDLAILTELIQPYERLKTLIALKGMSKPSFSYMPGLLIEKRISYVR